MPEKDPSNYSWITYLWVLAISSWGGIVGFHRKMQAGILRPFNVVEFVGEIAASAFVGMITFWLCELGNFPQLMTAALVGITGHMGSRALFQFERWAEKRLFGAGDK